jgi:hypothetical protein
LSWLIGKLVVYARKRCRERQKRQCSDFLESTVCPSTLALFERHCLFFKKMEQMIVVDGGSDLEVADVADEEYSPKKQSRKSTKKKTTKPKAPRKKKAESTKKTNGSPTKKGKKAVIEEEKQEEIIIEEKNEGKQEAEPTPKNSNCKISGYVCNVN